MSDSSAGPTVVLVHGAFADAGSWAPVTERLIAADVPVTAIVNPLRGVAADAAYVASFINQIDGPVLAVGHSYGGMIITNAVPQTTNVAGLVYVAAFAPDEGETLAGIVGRSDRQRSDDRRAGVPVPDRPRRRDSHRADHRPREVPRRLHRRPNPAAVRRLRTGPSARSPPAPSAKRPPRSPGRTCRPGPPSVPLTAPPASDVVRSMAQRADATITEIEGSHVIMISQPDAVTDVILTARNAVS